jgi:hypothetical protein
MPSGSARIPTSSTSTTIFRRSLPKTRSGSGSRCSAVRLRHGRSQQARATMPVIGSAGAPRSTMVPQGAIRLR